MATVELDILPSQAIFTSFPKISRLFRPVVITEKIDGTNAAVVVSSDVPYGYGADEVVGPGIVINRAPFEGRFDGWDPMYIYAQSRKQVISPENDNFGFATWVREHAHELVELGEGCHFGEWWGLGIQRGYNLDRKRFSLFNTSRWAEDRPACCEVVPVIAELNEFNTEYVHDAVKYLADNGSKASPGYMNPEGVVTFHKPSNSLFKTTIKGDDKGKEHGA